MGQYGQEAYIANYTVLCHRTRGVGIETPRETCDVNGGADVERGTRGDARPSSCATAQDRRFSYYPFYRFYPA